MADPMVTVMVITYNHRKYIGKAIQSVLDQDVDFKFEINIIDDCSTDGTQDVIRGYKKRYPDNINLFINAKNIGNKITQRNFIRGFRTLNGKYISILEGDDYWSSTKKLKKQIDFLEANSDFVACAHNVLKVYEDGSKEPHLFLPPPSKEVHDIDDLINIASYFHTTTLTYRNVLRGRVPRQFRNPYSCDLFVTIAHAEHGNIRFFDEVMSVYRAHSGGQFSRMSETEGWLFNIDGMRRYNRWLGYRHNRTFCGAIYRYCEFMLRHGKEEDGLTPWRRRKYRFLMVCYRAMFDYLSERKISAFHPRQVLRP